MHGATIKINDRYFSRNLVVCKSDDCLQENSGAASYCTCCLLLLLLFAVYDSYEIDIDEMESDWYDEEEEEKDTGEK
jgi:hypothetical protein